MAASVAAATMLVEVLTAAGIHDISVDTCSTQVYHGGEIGLEISPLSNRFMPVISSMEMLISGWEGKVHRVGAA